MTWVGDDVSSGSLPSYVLVSTAFAFHDQVSSSMLRQQHLMISVSDWYPLPVLVLNIDDNCLLIGALNLTEAVLTTASWQNSFHVCGKPNSTKSILLTISLEIKICTVLKALGEVASLHSSAFSLSQKGRQYFITKLFIPCLFIYFLICTGDEGRLGFTG